MKINLKLKNSQIKKALLSKLGFKDKKELAKSEVFPVLIVLGKIIALQKDLSKLKSTTFNSLSNAQPKYLFKNISNATTKELEFLTYLLNKNFDLISNNPKFKKGKELAKYQKNVTDGIIKILSNKNTLHKLVVKLFPLISNEIIITINKLDKKIG